MSWKFIVGMFCIVGLGSLAASLGMIWLICRIVKAVFGL